MFINEWIGQILHICQSHTHTHTSKCLHIWQPYTGKPTSHISNNDKHCTSTHFFILDFNHCLLRANKMPSKIMFQRLCRPQTGNSSVCYIKESRWLPLHTLAKKYILWHFKTLDTWWKKSKIKKLVI